MAKLTTSDLTSLTNETSAINTINNNFAAVEAAMENTLSRDGTTPNTMSADLDMNSNQILNVSSPTLSTHVATKAYVDGLLASAVPDGDKGDITVASSGTVWTIDSSVISTYGRTLTASSSASVARANLGLEIGTDVQAYDAVLDALASLTNAANKVPLFQGSGTATTVDFLDEDNMASDSATAVASQQSIKAYVDAAVASSTLPDGDYGDITVSGGGTTLTIDNDAVTFAKIQNINTSRLLGRTTASSGDVEEITLIDDDTMATATSTNVATAESVKAYTDASIAALPSPASDWELIATYTPTSVATQEIPLTGAYSSFQIVCDNMLPATDNRALQMRLSDDGGSTFKSGTGDYAFRYNTLTAAGTLGTDTGAASTFIGIAGSNSPTFTTGIGNQSDEGVSFTMDINVGGTRSNSFVYSGSFIQGAGTANQHYLFWGNGHMFDTSASPNRAQFYFNSGDIASGTIYLYGKKNS